MAGYAAGCPPDQILNFFRPKVYLQPKQLEMSAAARRADFICPECKALVERGKPPLKKCKDCGPIHIGVGGARGGGKRSEEHTSELQSLRHLVCRLLLEKK